MFEKIREFWRGFTMGKERLELESALEYLADEILADVVTARDEGGLLPRAFPIAFKREFSDFYMKVEIGYRDGSIQEFEVAPPPGWAIKRYSGENDIDELNEKIEYHNAIPNPPKFKILISEEFRNYLVLKMPVYFSININREMEWRKSFRSSPVKMEVGETSGFPWLLNTPAPIHIMNLGKH